MKPAGLKLALKILLPVLVLALGAFGSWWLMENQPEAQSRPAPMVLPLVRVTEVQPETLRIDVETQGNVAPRTEISLVPQVSGKVIDVSPSLRSGGFFAEGDALVKIEPRDFELRVVQRKAAVAQAKLRLELEQAEADSALRAWRREHGDEPADPLVLREPQLAEARAALASAEAALEQAELDLERTTLVAPFPGRVRSATVDVGQQVMAGAPVARIYSIDVAEVRLPIPDDAVEYLDLPLHYSDKQRPSRGPEVLLEAEFAGRVHRWTGVVDRVEGEIDSKTRQLTLVARVQDPYAAGEDPDRPPLAAGMFVEATVRGRTYHEVFSLPRSALRPGDEVLMVDGENRLRFEPVDVLRRGAETVLIASGLQAGQRVCLTNLEAPTDGMLVRIAEPAPMTGSSPR